MGERLHPDREFPAEFLAARDPAAEESVLYAGDTASTEAAEPDQVLAGSDED